MVLLRSAPGNGTFDIINNLIKAINGYLDVHDFGGIEMVVWLTKIDSILVVDVKNYFAAGKRVRRESAAIISQKVHR